MKKKIILVISIILIVLLVTTLIITSNISSKTDAEEFSEEYKGVPVDNVFVYRNIDEIIKILEKGTGIVYLGFPECPWCQKYVVYLNEVAKTVENQTQLAVMTENAGFNKIDSRASAVLVLE